MPCGTLDALFLQTSGAMVELAAGYGCDKFSVDWLVSVAILSSTGLPARPI